MSLFRHGQTTFRDVSAGLIRDKSACCELCRKLPAEGKPFGACKQCQRVAYCSRECQKKDWKTHKLECLLTADCMRKLRETDQEEAADHAARGLPSLVHRRLLFQDFFEAHSIAFRQAWEAAVLECEGGPKAFDFDNSCLLFLLMYRKDNGGNPALAYRLVSTTFMDYTVLARAYNLDDDLSKRIQATREDDAKYQAFDWGTLKIYFKFITAESERMLDQWMTAPIPKYPPDRPESLLFRGLPPRDRFTSLSDIIDVGLVLRWRTHQGFCSIGELVKSDRATWRWVQSDRATAALAARYGLSPPSI